MTEYIPSNFNETLTFLGQINALTSRYAKLLEFVKQIANRENSIFLEDKMIYEPMIKCVAQDLLKEIGEL